MIAVALLVALLFQAPPASGSIEGFVIRAGVAPPAFLANARMELAGPGGTALARTDAGGHFAFSNLPAGNYRLRVTKDGYVRQEYRQIGLEKPGPPLPLKTGERLGNIVFRLEPAATISGVIQDATGARIPGVMVQALKRGFDARGNPSLRLLTSTVTDDRGVYRLFWLDPGEYFISATPPPPPFGTSDAAAYIQTYYPGFLDIDSAKPVRLEYGHEAIGIDFRIFRVGAMTILGYVTGLLQGPVATSVFLVPPEDGAGVARYTGRSESPSGHFSIPGVAPGSYVLTATLGTETGTIRINVKSHPDNTLRVDLSIGEGIAIPGRIYSDTPIDLKNARVHLSEMDPAMPEPVPASIMATGQFVVPAVQPGSYTVEVVGLVEDQFVKRAAVGSVDALEKPIAVAYPSSPELQIQIASDGGRILGMVYDRTNAVFANAEVILVPTSANATRKDLYRTAVTGDDGQFTIRGIVPGDYKLFAWEDLEPNAHLNLDFMRTYENRGTPVHIEPNAQGTVSLQAIVSP